ncbi:protein of unknown function [Agreia sp. COWG]|nr:protein of unknown function [Agreia sp. COWG]
MENNLKTLGISCDKTSFQWCVISIDVSGMTLVDRGKSGVPANSSRGAELLWLFLEIQNLAGTFLPDRAVLKRAETGGSGRSAPLDHAEMDGVALAALQSKSVPTESLKWATISSRLGKRSKTEALEIVQSMSISRGVPKSHLDPLAAAAAGQK